MQPYESKPTTFQSVYTHSPVNLNDIPAVYYDEGLDKEDPCPTPIMSNGLLLVAMDDNINAKH
jgi:hypothetical protein